MRATSAESRQLRKWALVSGCATAPRFFVVFVYFLLSYHRFSSPVYLARVFTLRDFLENPLSDHIHVRGFSSPPWYCTYLGCSCAESSPLSLLVNFHLFPANSCFRQRRQETHKKLCFCILFYRDSNARPFA